MSQDFLNIRGINTLFADIRKQLQQSESILIRRLQYIGEEAVNHAREHGAYTDQTGNLRSSIGYIILKDGVHIDGSAPKIYEDGEEGVFNMMNLLEELRKEFPQGIYLIVCAGMEYASYVENIHGKDVLTGAKLLAEALIRKLVSKK